MRRRLWTFLAGLVALHGAECQESRPAARAVEIAASSTLVEPGQGDRYAAYKAFDGDPATFWVEGKSDHGIGESLWLLLDTEISADAIVLMPGLFLPEYHKANNRIKRVRVQTENTTFILPCEDQMKPQRFSLSKPIRFRSIRLEIVEVYPGSRWADTCLSEVAFSSGGKRVAVDVSAQTRWRSLPEGARVEVDGTPAVLVKRRGRTTADTRIRLGPDVRNVSVQYTDFRGDGGIHDWVPKDREVSVVGRTLERERVGDWNTYWYLVEVPTDDAGSVGLRWMVAQFVDLVGASGAVPTRQVPLEMVSLEGGTFRMGDTAGDARGKELPVHAVTVSSFSIGTYEVTQAQWVAVMGPNPSHFGGDNSPVEQVSWFDAVDFCNRLSAKEGLELCYTVYRATVSCDFRENGYRLPTEAEWEYAAKGGSLGKGYQYAGARDLASVGWYQANAEGATHPVGGKQANELGLYDFSGNVNEWCWDWYESYSADEQTDPVGPTTGKSRVRRGGSWDDNVPGYVSTAYRGLAWQAGADDYTGFRVARSGGTRTPEAEPEPALAAPPPAAAKRSDDFVLVEGWTFPMGDAEDEKPVHSVTVSSFLIGKHEVTQAEWVEVMGSNPSRYPGDDLPVERVSWRDALEFCNRLSVKEGLEPCYYGIGSARASCDFERNGYRLPTEAEWEYAARGGRLSRGYAYAGGNDAKEVAWYKDDAEGSTHPVGRKLPNELGLFDMSGNVQEWCWDWHGSYLEAGGDQSNRAGERRAARASRRELRRDRLQPAVRLPLPGRPRQRR